MAGISRISDQMRTNTLLSTLQSTNLKLGLLQQQIATGNRLTSPDVDPVAADQSFSVERNIQQQDQLLNNIQSATNIFSETDSQLGNAADTIVQQAITYAASSVSTGATPTDPSLVQSLSNSLLNIANSKVGDVYIFGGTNCTSAPFSPSAAGVRYVGQSAGMMGMLGGGSGATQVGVTGDQAFGAMSGQMQCSQNLRPSMTTDTRLADLDGASGNGIRLGTIVISDQSLQKQVTLAGCDCIGDVIDRINTAGAGEITASLSSDGQALQISSASGGLTVTEQGASQAAHDLGIFRSSDQGTGFTGNSVAPRVTLTTSLSNLRAGAGIDVAHELLITNGGGSAKIDLSKAQTVGDVINAITAANVGVKAQVNAAGDGIDVVNLVSGAEMRIGENGGTTAEDLGVRSFNRQTLLSDLNGGAGVRANSQSTDPVTAGESDFRITASDGSTFDIALGSARTVGDVIDLINNATGGKVTAGLATVGNGIALTDSAGGAGQLGVIATNASDAAQDLGLTGDSVKTTQTTLAAADCNPICPDSIFTHLTQLASALKIQDVNQRVQELTRLGSKLTSDLNNLINLRAQVGGLTKDMTNSQSNIQDEQTSSKSLLSNLKDTDFTSAVSQLQALQTAMQGNLIAASRIMGTSLLDFLK
jgi:flagellin-like hook-associated protein FlgL